ncbi:MAG: protein kinase [Magnetococcales bacterium]|nr:protein kinase [Magnetococcales bacterium]
MSIVKGQTLVSSERKLTIQVQEKLGEGGQGEVFRAVEANRTYALKWYNPSQATPDQKRAIAALVKHGRPRGEAGSRFLWPIDLVEDPLSGRFGYLMQLMDTKQFASLGEIQAHRKPAPSYGTMCRISFLAASSYKRLHMEGYCYRDISRRNLLFNPLNGDIFICDNDNVGIEGQSSCQVMGTMENMPPELILNRAEPSTKSDLHALSVLLFELWIWHHPMHGLKEFCVRSWDLPAKVRIYGEEPLFVFDPEDDSNRLPDDPDYNTARKRWEQCPKIIKDLFIKAFTVGLHNPDQRVTEGEWQRAFLRLLDGMLYCPHCGAENLWTMELTSCPCWHCHTELLSDRQSALPPRLVIKHPTRGTYHFSLLLGKKLSTLFTNPEEEEKARLFGEVTQHPTNPQIWGIRNLTQTPWRATFPDGSRKMVEPERAAPLTIGIKLDFDGFSGEIVA